MSHNQLHNNTLSYVSSEQFQKYSLEEKVRYFYGDLKLFADGADKQGLLEMNENPIISGMTTNPSLMRKAGVSNYREFCRDVLKSIQKKSISFEVFADELGGMESQALEIATWGKNVYVKIPSMNSKGESTVGLIKRLTARGIPLNITAVFTTRQAIEIASALAGGAPSYLSVFAGRIADTGQDPMPFVSSAVEVCREVSPSTEVLWASTREVYNFKQAQLAGCSIITAPNDLLKKLPSLGRSALDLCYDTVKTFKADSEASKFTL